MNLVRHRRGHSARSTIIGSTDDDRFAQPETTFDDPALNDRQLFHRTFDPEIVDLANGALAFNFRHDLRGAPGFLQDLPQLFEVFLFARETERNEIDAQLDSEGHVGQILFGQRGQIHMDTGEIDVPARTECARSQDNGANPVVLFRSTRTCMSPLSRRTTSSTATSSIKPS
jgi:hypothetical protein